MDLCVNQMKYKHKKHASLATLTRLPDIAASIVEVAQLSLDTSIL